MLSHSCCVYDNGEKVITHPKKKAKYSQREETVAKHNKRMAKAHAVKKAKKNNLINKIEFG